MLPPCSLKKPRLLRLRQSRRKNLLNNMPELTDESEMPTGEYLAPGWEELELELDDIDPPAKDVNDLRARLEEKLALLSQHFSEFLPAHHIKPPSKEEEAEKEQTVKYSQERVTTLLIGNNYELGAY